MRHHVDGHLIQPSSARLTVIKPFPCGFCGRSAKWMLQLHNKTDCCIKFKRQEAFPIRSLTAVEATPLLNFRAVIEEEEINRALKLI